MTEPDLPLGQVIEGDSLEVMATFPDNSVDAVITDPPAGISFMAQTWDHHRGGRGEWVAWMTQVMSECYRVLKPGGHALVWALPRTSHWTGWAIESAGFEVRDKVLHVFLSGMPKSADISKHIDRLKGVEREVLGTRVTRDIRHREGRPHGWGIQAAQREGPTEMMDYPITEPATDEAREWNGWGTNLKPAYEDWWLARKPFDGSVAGNVLEWGTGAINIDATRIPLKPGDEYTINTFDDGAKPFGGGAGHAYTSRKVAQGRDGEASAEKRYTEEGSTNFAATPGPRGGDAKGRWPSNVALTDPEAFDGGIEGVVGGGDRSSGLMKGGTQRNSRSIDYGKMPDTANLTDTYGDSGGVSRIFIIPKAARSQKEPNWHGLEEFEGQEEAGHSLGPMAGRGEPGLKCTKCGHWKVSGSPCVCDDPEWVQSEFKRPRVRNDHPTVKNLDLMVHFVRLICPPGGVVLDPFLGSGTTAKAAELEGRRWVGIEKDPRYARIARARLTGQQQGLGLE